MDVKKLALLIGALMMAGISAFMARSLFSAAPAPVASAQPVAVPVGPEVLVAVRPLPVGTIIGPESLRYQPWPKELIDNAYYLRGAPGGDPVSLQGTVVRTEITAGQPLTQGSLVKPGDRGFLAAALGPGMRAVTVSVSAQQGVAGFVFPGDRVDLMLTQTVTGGGDGAPLRTTETFVRNLRVLATDQKSDKTTDDQGKTVVSAFSSVTMEATPKIAEKIAVAQTIGTLSLSLRPLADTTAELERAIAAGTVTLPATDDPKAERQMLLQIASRPIDTDGTLTTGADVSRFQRSTVPPRQAGGGFGTGANSMLPSPAPAPAQDPAAGGGAPAVRGPVIRVARGNTVTAVPVGGK
ncbi:MAG: Flp pilus assembly protein CpaB [Sphingomonas sp.]